MKKKRLLFSAILTSLLLSVSLFGSEKVESEQRLTEYLGLLKENMHALGPWGDHEKGEIEICTNVELIKEIEEIQRQRLMRKGLSKKQAYMASRVGVIAEDTYWLLIRDAVRFPSNFYGTYDRLLWKSSLDGPPGVAVVPVDEEGNIYLNVNFRHATRSWELEVPRGTRNEREAVEKAALRELKEETGLAVNKLDFLGNMVPDSGSTNTVVPIFLGKITFKGHQDQEYSEAILKVLKLSRVQLEESIKRGYIEVPTNQGVISVNVRDSFITYSLYQASLKGLI
ncbi:MAG: NUDIX domain-containing protein [Chlamydiales bacterium]|nr:NUDIX hydrolase [Chlamydiales bacterium]NCF71599.1 NUDIX domain-containing protein [Chlamydiales bacterium]